MTRPLTGRFLLLVLLAGPLLADAGAAKRIRAFLDSSPVARTAFWGICVVDLDDGRVIFDRNGNRPFVPASNVKLFTTALALLRLGPDYRFQTRILADHKPVPTDVSEHCGSPAAATRTAMTSQ